MADLVPAEFRVAEEAAVADEVVLAVDLDGTLLQSDMLLESFWELMSRDIRGAMGAAFRLADGRAALKSAIADKAHIDPAMLPYNPKVLAYIRDWREKGGRTALVTASDQRIADAIAAHLDCFDEVHGSDGANNLKGSIKAEFLTNRFGAQRFDYMGDSLADLPVWHAARQTITVGAAARLRRKVDAALPGAVHLGGPASARAYLKAMRPHQWAKNALIFVPPLAAHLGEAAQWFAALAAFAAFSLIASGVYVLNDLLDLDADRMHPRKKNRPLASGALPILHGMALVPLLLGAGLMLALAFTPWQFVTLLVGYFALTLAYSLRLKRLLVIDICVLAGLYTIRLVGGGLATGVVLSPWLLAFSIFLFLSLAAVKRQAELVSDRARGRDGAAGRSYVVDDLPIVAMMALSAGYVSVVVMALYLNSQAMQQLYTSPLWLWGVCPVLLFWISRVVMLAHRGQMHDDPVVFALKDPASRLCALGVAAIAVAAALL